jgi:hypothetical protein
MAAWHQKTYERIFSTELQYSEATLNCSLLMKNSKGPMFMSRLPRIFDDIHDYKRSSIYIIAEALASSKESRESTDWY